MSDIVYIGIEHIHPHLENGPLPNDIMGGVGV